MHEYYSRLSLHNCMGTLSWLVEFIYNYLSIKVVC